MGRQLKFILKIANSAGTLYYYQYRWFLPPKNTTRLYPTEFGQRLSLPVWLAESTNKAGLVASRATLPSPPTRSFRLYEHANPTTNDSLSLHQPCRHNKILSRPASNPSGKINSDYSSLDIRRPRQPRDDVSNIPRVDLSGLTAEWRWAGRSCCSVSSRGLYLYLPQEPFNRVVLS